MAVALLVVGLPVAFAVAIAVQLLGVARGEESLLFIITVWATVWGWSAFRIVRWPCPRCAQPWLSGQEPQLRSSRRCANCGLGLYEAP